MNKFTVCIIRVSTDDQKTLSQRLALLAEIERRGLTPVMLRDWSENRCYYEKKPNVCVIVEEHWTGKDPDRPGLKWAEQQVKGGWVDAVLCYDVSRLGRSDIANLQFANACIARKVELWMHTGTFDIHTGDGKMMFSVMSAMAERERERIVERTKAGVRARINTCKKCGNQKDQHKPNGKCKFEPTPHGGTAKGWTSKKVLKLLPRMYELIDMGFSNYHIKRVLGLNLRTIAKYRKEREQPKIDRKTLNIKVYGKSNAKS